MKKRKIEDIKLFKILNDEIFWIKFTKICYDVYLIQRLRQYRTKKVVPTKKLLDNFIEEYKIITGDTRDNQVIKLELLSEEND